jgi:hypothetical protein
MTGKKGIGDILQILTIAVLFLVILILVVFSAASYQHATETQNRNNRSRALLSYVVSSVESSRLSEVKERDFDGAEGLSISMEDGKFERRIYMKDGKLLEEYAESKSGINPKDALVIGETEVFEVNRVADDLIEIKTDAGSSYVNVRR